MTRFHPMMQDVEQGYHAMSDSQVSQITRRFIVAATISFISIGAMNTFS